MINRRDVLELGLAAGALSLPAQGAASPRVGGEAFWADVVEAFPMPSKVVNLANSGGGACPSATLDLIARYQKIAAAGGEDTNAVLTSLKESGSSASIREAMARAFGCGADEIALTRNAMEGLGIGLLGVDLKPGDEILTTRADYDSCIQIIRQRQLRDGVRLKLIDVPMPASIDEEVAGAFEAACSPRTKLILMCHMYNKNGQILPVRKIADMARGKGIVTVVDGAQTTAHIDFRISDLGCDVFATSLHKWFYGPRGTGFVYVRRDMIPKVWPIWPSWSGKPATSIEKYEDYGTVSKAVSAALPSVFAFNEKIGAAKEGGAPSSSARPVARSDPEDRPRDFAYRSRPGPLLRDHRVPGRRRGAGPARPDVARAARSSDRHDQSDGQAGVQGKLPGRRPDEHAGAVGAVRRRFPLGRPRERLTGAQIRLVQPTGSSRRRS